MTVLFVMLYILAILTLCVFRYVTVLRVVSGEIFSRPSGTLTKHGYIVRVITDKGSESVQLNGLSMSDPIYHHLQRVRDYSLRWWYFDFDGRDVWVRFEGDKSKDTVLIPNVLIHNKFRLEKDIISNETLGFQVAGNNSVSQILCPNCLEEFTADSAVFAVYVGEYKPVNPMLNLEGYITSNNFISSQSKISNDKILGTIGELGLAYTETKSRGAFRSIKLSATDETFIKTKLGHLEPEKVDAICTQLKIGITRRVCPKCGAMLPIRAGEFETFLCSLLGSTSNGKSSFLASLITHAKMPGAFKKANSQWMLMYDDGASSVPPNMVSSFKSGTNSPTDPDKRYYITLTLSHNSGTGINLIIADAAGASVSSPDYLHKMRKEYSRSEFLFCLLNFEGTDVSDCQGISAFSELSIDFAAADRPIGLMLFNKADKADKSLLVDSPNIIDVINTTEVVNIDTAFSEARDILDEGQRLVAELRDETFGAVTAVTSEVLAYPTISKYLDNNAHTSTINALLTILGKLGVKTNA